MGRERILITVKTYPTLSSKYGETVCTAGMRKDGSWIRLYPVPFRRWDQSQQFKKFDWVECELEKVKNDPRPESYRPLNPEDFIAVDHLDTSDNWRERRKFLIQKRSVFTRRSELLKGSTENSYTLGIFKPERITKFFWEEEEDREWDSRKLEQMRNHYGQFDLFEDNAWRETFELVKKVPYKFSYRFEDADGNISNMQILDWEIGALYWNCLKSTSGNESGALEKVKQKYFDEFLKKDLHFFMGTMKQQQLRNAPNPWIIIGVFPIPHQQQMDLF